MFLFVFSIKTGRSEMAGFFEQIQVAWDTV